MSANDAKPKGTSASAKRRHWLMENDPEKYEEIKRQQRERERQRREEMREQWAIGTRAAELDKEAFMAKRREISRQSRLKKKSETSRQTRTSLASTPQKGRVNLTNMTQQERQDHRNARRREVYHAKSKQKKVADKRKHASKMREFRLHKKQSVGQTIPNATSTPKASDPLAATSQPLVAATSHPLAATSQPLVAATSQPLVATTSHVPATPPKRDRMRQHCYNTVSKVKETLNRFSDEERASMTVNLLLTRTPQKRRRNLEKLFKRLAVKKSPGHGMKRRRMKPMPGHERTAQYMAKSVKLRQSRYASVKKEAEKFYLRPNVSRVLPHGRYATKHGPGHVMFMTLDAAHRAFEEESGKHISRALFSSLRPPNVRKVGTVAADTCLCICCTNVKLKIDALNRRIKSAPIPPEGKLMDFVLCPYIGRWPKLACIEGKCIACKDFIRPFTLAAREIFHDEISWLHWERRPRQTEDGGTNVKLDVFDYSGTVYDLLAQLSGDLQEPVKGTSFMKHLFNAYWQQSQYLKCKDSLQQGQLLMLQDFAKNRTATYSHEVKSAFFGKQQVSLHPTVCWYKDTDGQLVRHVIMFFSDDIKHDAHHVHAVTQKAIDFVMASTKITEVIIWSDGAASQYKGRKTFADLSLYPLPIERHFFGSEHGKGESDAETGRFSQALRRASAGGANFRHAKDMADFAASHYKQQDQFKRYSSVHIPLGEILRDRPEVDVSTIPGTRGFHQVVRMKKYCVGTRNHSCFCSGCRAGDGSCCINKAFIKPLEFFKMTPSTPQDEAFLEDKEQENLPTVPVYTNSDCPAVGQWVNIVGQVLTNKKKGIFEERAYKAVVIDRPEGGYEDFFYVQFLKKTPAGSYVIAPRDISHIHPDTAEAYKWHVVPAPVINNRNHHFFDS